MSSIGKFIRSYPILRIVNIIFYPLLIYVIIGLIYSSLFSIFYSFIYWICGILIVIGYLILDYNRLCITLDTENKQKIYFQEKNKRALKNKSLTKDYKNWLIGYAEIDEINQLFKPLDFNTTGECCIYCFASFVLFLIIASFTLIYQQGETAWIWTILIFLTVIIIYPILRIVSERKMYKTSDSEIKRILFEEETGYPPLENGRFTYKYKAWLVQQARFDSR